jgi:hypothetical protein
LLLANEGKAARERLTLIRLFEELRGLGYDGGYDAVRRYARQSSTAAAYVPLTFAPGEAYQFDWSHEIAFCKMQGDSAEMQGGARARPGKKQHLSMGWRVSSLLKEQGDLSWPAGTSREEGDNSLDRALIVRRRRDALPKAQPSSENELTHLLCQTFV